MNDDLKRLCDAAKTSALDGMIGRFTDDEAETIVRAVLNAMRNPTADMRRAMTFEAAERDWPAAIDSLLG